MHRILTGICLIQMVEPGKSLPQRGLSSRSRTFLPWSTASRSCPLWWHTGSNPRDPKLSLLFYPRRTGYSYLCNKPNTLSFALETQPSIWQAQTPGTKSTRQLISASKTVFQKPRSWDSHTCLVPFPWIWTYDLLSPTEYDRNKTRLVPSLCLKVWWLLLLHSWKPLATYMWGQQSWKGHVEKSGPETRLCGKWEGGRGREREEQHLTEC